VYNLRGCKFTLDNTKNFTYGGESSGDNNYTTLFDSEGNINSISKEDFFLAGGSFLLNTKGVFKFPKLDVYDHKNKKTYPIGIKFTINQDVITTLKQDYNVKGFFFVRQKRIPNILAQGYSIGVDKSSYIPMLFDSNLTDSQYPDGKYFAESFINTKLSLSTTYKDRKISTGSKQSSGLLCVDAMVNKQLQSIFDNSEFTLNADYLFELKKETAFERSYYMSYKDTQETPNVNNIQSKLIYVPADTPLKYVDDYGFSTRAGSAEDVKDFRFFDSKDYDKDNNKIVRGVYCPFIGTNQNLTDNAIYTIRVSNYSQAYETQYFKIRGNDLSPFMAVSPRYEIEDSELVKNINENTQTYNYLVPTVFRGDCFTATVTIRINTNFIDSEVPTADTIVDPNS
jgi:hypothetical protein